MHQAEAEGGRFDADSAHRAAGGDGFQLWHDRWQQPVFESLVDEGFVGGHALHVGEHSIRVDVQYAVEAAYVYFAFVCALAMSKEVRGRLRESDCGAAGP